MKRKEPSKYIHGGPINTGAGVRRVTVDRGANERVVYKGWFDGNLTHIKEGKNKEKIQKSVQLDRVRWRIVDVAYKYEQSTPPIDRK